MKGFLRAPRNANFHHITRPNITANIGFAIRSAECSERANRADWRQPLQRSAIVLTTARLDPSKTISAIGSEMTIVGKLVCKDLIKVYGFVEGELYASNALIADGARIEGEIVAEELTIAGRVKGDIHALRVKLHDTSRRGRHLSPRAVDARERAV
jgi:cytoskeletal protein CcmA (bactofilin family)